MTRRFCPNCGAALQFSSQKFCTNCGTNLPEPGPAGPSIRAPSPLNAPGLKVLIIVAIIVIVLGAVAVLLLPDFLQAPGSSSSGQAEGADGVSVLQSPPGTPLPGVTSVPTSRTPVSTGVPVTVTKTMTTVPTTTPSTAPSTVVSARTTVPTTLTAVPTAIYDVEPTTKITMEVTQVPPQPPSSSYTSETPGAPYIDPSALEARIHDLINEQRQQNSLAPLYYDPFLSDIARGHSWDMVTRNFFEHVNPDGKSPRDRGDAAGYPCIRYIKPYVYEGIAENLYQGNRASGYYSNASGAVTGYDWLTLEDIAQATVTGWMDSPGHRKNILTDHYYNEGIGVAFAPDNKVYVTENFC